MAIGSARPVAPVVRRARHEEEERPKERRKRPAADTGAHGHEGEPAVELSLSPEAQAQLAGAPHPEAATRPEGAGQTAKSDAFEENPDGAPNPALKSGRYSDRMV